MRRPLQGIKVVEFAAVVAAPYAALLLSDLGADVIKVEPPQGDETRRYAPFKPGTDFAGFNAAMNRSKRSISLDMKQPAAVSAYLDICAEADVVLENFRPGVSDRLGVGYEAIKVRNPEIIYCAISGFGHKGPRVGEPAMDMFIQAFSGQMSMMGHEGGPPARIGGPMMDFTAALYAALGIVAAIHDKARTGQGSLVQTSLLEGQVSALSYMWPSLQFRGEPTGRMGSGHPDFCPYQAFPAKDGDVVIAALNDRLFGCVADAMGRPELATDPRFKSNPDRVANRAELLPIIEGFVAARTMDEVADVMQAKGAPATPVNTLDRVRDDKQVVALGGLRQIDQPGVGPVDVAHQALWFDGERAEADGPAPGLGEHGREILRDVGLKDDAIDAMLETGALVMNS